MIEFLSPRRLWIWLPLASILCLPAAATELAGLRSGGDTLEWEPAAAHGLYKLTVLGAGVHRSRLFAPGERLELQLFDAAGQPLPDGSYDWELTLMPPPVDGLWHDPENGRDGGRPLAERPPTPKRVPTQVGSFQVISGRLVTPGAKEPARTTASRPDNDPGSPRDSR